MAESRVSSCIELTSGVESSSSVSGFTRFLDAVAFVVAFAVTFGLVVVSFGFLGFGAALGAAAFFNAALGAALALVFYEFGVRDVFVGINMRAERKDGRTHYGHDRGKVI